VIEKEVIPLNGPLENDTIEMDTPQIIDIVDEEDIIDRGQDDVAAALSNYTGRGHTVEFDYNPNNERQQQVKQEKKHDYDLQRAKRKDRREAFGQSLDDPNIISEMENIPAYKRRKIDLVYKKSSGSPPEFFLYLFLSEINLTILLL